MEGTTRSFVRRGEGKREGGGMEVVLEEEKEEEGSGTHMMMRGWRAYRRGR